MGERRPLQSRDARWAKASASWLAARRFPPNLISVGSVIAALFAAAAFVGSRNAAPTLRLGLMIVAAVAIQLRLICNLLDGMVAVEGKLGSKSGEIFNDLPDRIADPLILVGAGYAVHSFAWASALGWCAGLLAVMTAYLRLLGGATGAGQDFGGPMAKPQRMAVMTFAALIEGAAAFTPWRDFPLVAALGLIIIGCVVTVARRTVRLRRTLESR
jgi:phosphatidylglycerophosphate synthase